MKLMIRGLREPAPWLGAVLVLAAALALVACDNDMNITGPDLPGPGPIHNSVWVTGTLTPQSSGGCNEAWLYYDGRRIGIQHELCGLGTTGCRELKVQGFKEESPGPHTLEVEVVHQTGEEVRYLVAAEVSDRPNGAPTLRLGPVSRTLREGDRVSFTFDAP